MSKIPDYAYSKSLLSRLNDLIEGRSDLKSYFNQENVNYWYVFQQRIFNDIKAFASSERYYKEEERRIIHKAKELVVGFAILVVSFVSIIWSIVARKEILVFSVDTISDTKLKIDKRLKPLYEALKLENKSYITFYHTVTNSSVLRRVFYRREGAIFMESFDYVFKLVSFLLPSQPNFKVEESFGNKNEVEFVEYLLKKYSQLLIFSKIKTKFLSVYLRVSCIKKAFMIDDVRNYHEIILSCRANNIKTVAIQHGHFGPYHIGFLKHNLSGNTVKPDILIVWSEFWKKELIRLNSIFSETEIVVGGAPDMYEKNDYENNTDINYFLVPFERDLDKEIVLRLMREVSRVEGWKVLFKLRDGVTEDSQFDSYKFSKEDRIKIVGMKDTKKAFKMARLVAGVYSTLLYDALAYGKHVAVIKTPSPYRPEGLLYYHLADEIDPEQDISPQLSNLLNVSSEEIKRRREELTAGMENVRLVETLRKLMTDQ